MDKNIVISVKSIFAILGALLGVYLVFKLGTIIGYILMSLLITISLERAVRFLARQTLLNRKMGRPIAVLLVYLLVFLALSLAISLGLNPLITQSQKLVQTLSKHEDIISFGNSFSFSTSSLISGLVNTSGGVVTATKSFFNNLAALFSILILSIYMSLDWNNIKSRFLVFFKDKKKEKVQKAITDIEDNVGLWLRGELVLMILIGVLSYVGLLIVGVQFPLALALISGILEIVPIIGPIISAIIAALVAVIDSPIKALLIVAVFALIQQTEGNIIVPKVMQRVSGFSPIIILIALLVGSNLFGLIGAVIAIPVLMVGAVVVRAILGVEK